MKKMFKVNPGCKVRGIQETIYFYDPEFDLEAGDKFEVIYESLNGSMEVDGYYIQVISGNFQNEQMIINKEELDSVKVTPLEEDEYPVFDDYPIFDEYINGYIDGYRDGYKDGYED